MFLHPAPGPALQPRVRPLQQSHYHECHGPSADHLVIFPAAGRGLLLEKFLLRLPFFQQPRFDPQALDLPNHHGRTKKCSRQRFITSGFVLPNLGRPRVTVCCTRLSFALEMVGQTDVSIRGLVEIINTVTASNSSTEPERPTKSKQVRVAVRDAALSLYSLLERMKENAVVSDFFCSEGVNSRAPTITSILPKASISVSRTPVSDDAAPEPRCPGETPILLLQLPLPRISPCPRVYSLPSTTFG